MSNHSEWRQPNPQRSGREPIFNVPAVVAALIGVFLLVHGFRELVTDDFIWLYQLAFVPARVTWWLQPADFMQRLLASVQGAPPDAVSGQLALGRLIVASGSLAPWSLVTHAFLHGSWTHVILNSVWLLAFGAPLASRFGAVRFTLFFFICAVGGAVAHYLSGPMEVIPMIGASGAISGCMGAAVRFAFNVRGGLFGGPASVHLARADSLADTFRNRRAMMFAGAWFITNILFGVLARPLGVSESIVAWQAHIGGFLTGLLLFGFFDPHPAGSSASEWMRDTD
ncbi:rhomboid family intramembrane serine protease [Camelimonas fluminis]|uniref:Rhomboid family intramembrane serine protease n=1 Tax=Camelimonas fluminis TaxID=1576911 RepID=A0ABV7UCV3_9HYPH|nr:rhomboid family intramembrane serine protease [Camelimonas fluminis]GHE48872.1 rhomboid family intramembrane serine protease [Camelimonas fluminis]